MNFVQLIFYFILIIMVVMPLLFLFFDAEVGFGCTQSLLKIRERKARSFLKSPYKFYKFFKPKCKDSFDFDSQISDAVNYLEKYALNCSFSYDDFTKYVANILKYVKAYIAMSKTDASTKTKDISGAYRDLLYQLYIHSSFLKTELKDHSEDVVFFLYSLKPQSYLQVTKNDYKAFYSKDINWFDYARDKRVSILEASTINFLLGIEKDLCGKKSRLLIPDKNRDVED